MPDGLMPDVILPLTKHAVCIQAKQASSHKTSASDAIIVVPEVILVKVASFKENFPRTS
jgi:hypothetical protein